jgi:hypothetical protein
MIRSNPVPRLAGVTLLAATFLLTGCFPLELQVTSQGEIVIPRAEGVLVYNPAGPSRLITVDAAKELPAFAVVSSDGTRLARAGLALDENGDAQNSSQLLLTDLESRVTTELTVVENMSFLQWDPTGRYLSYAFVSGQNYDNIDESLPELKLFNVADQSEKSLGKNTSSIHRWTADGKGIWFLKTEAKDTDGRLGSLCLYDVAKGQVRKVARVLQAEWFDVSPDGKEIILSARGMAAAGTRAAPVDENNSSFLFVVDTQKGSFRRLEYNAAFARYSPDGARVAILKDNALFVTDREFAEPQDKLTRCVGELENSAKFHLSWLSNTELLAIRKRSVYGNAGFMPELVAVNVENRAVRSLQDGIEEAVRKAISALANQ